MGANLITKAEYKARAAISSTTQDTTIDLLLPQVSALVKSVCRRTFVDYVSTPKVEYFEEGGNSYIPLEYPIIAVTSLELSEDYGKTFSSLVEFTDYAWSKKDDTIKSIGKDFAQNTNAYRLTYTAGYTTLPEDLKLAICDMITYYLRNDSSVHSSKAPGTNTVQIEYITTTSLPAHIKRVLDLYTSSYV